MMAGRQQSGLKFRGFGFVVADVTCRVPRLACRVGDLALGYLEGVVICD